MRNREYTQKSCGNATASHSLFLTKVEKDHGTYSVVFMFHYTRLRARVSRIQARAIHLVAEASMASRLPFLFLLR